MIGSSDPCGFPGCPRRIGASNDPTFQSELVYDCITEVPGGYSPCEIEFIEYMQFIIDLYREHRSERIDIKIQPDEEARLRNILYYLNVLIAEIDCHKAG